MKKMQILGLRTLILLSWATSGLRNLF